MDNEFDHVHSKTNEMGQGNYTIEIVVTFSQSSHIFSFQIIMAVSHEITTTVIVIIHPMRDMSGPAFSDNFKGCLVQILYYFAPVNSSHADHFFPTMKFGLTRNILKFCSLEFLSLSF